MDMVTLCEEKEGVMGGLERIGSDNLVRQTSGSPGSRCGYRPSGVKIYCETLQKILYNTYFSDLSS